MHYTAVKAISNNSGTLLLVLLLAPGLLILIGVVVGFLFYRRRAIEGAAQPGYYHILGIDKTSGGRREVTFHADSEASARGRAEMDGIVVTEIRQIDRED